jgi:hypothetical protein
MHRYIGKNPKLFIITSLFLRTPLQALRCISITISPLPISNGFLTILLDEPTVLASLLHSTDSCNDIVCDRPYSQFT